MSRAVLLAAVAGLAIVLTLAVLGRWEGDRAEDEQVRGIERTRALVGSGLDSAALVGYRITSWADCLFYRLDGNPYAVELCFDEQGRLLEAADRRQSDDPSFWSVRPVPAAAPRVDPATVFGLLVELGALPKTTEFRGVLPLAADLQIEGAIAPGDTGPIIVE